MIDKETREKILNLWRENYTKTEIKKKTGVSLPTIRKIIREGGERSSSKVVSDFYPVDIFVINTTRNWPRKGASIIQALRNGYAFWALGDLLGQIFNYNIVQQILQQIESLGKFGVFQATVKHISIGEEEVSVLMLESSFLNTRNNNRKL